MKILVTGGAGYLGSVVVPRLLALGQRIRVVDTFWFGRESFSESATALAEGRLELVEADVRSLPNAVLDGIEYVCHLAALSNDPTSDVSPQIARAINVDGLTGLVAAMRDRGVRNLIFASSASVYDGVPHEALEEDHVAPQGVYSETKFAGEQLLNADPSMLATILRFGTLGGAAPRMRFDLVVNAMVRDAFARGAISLYGGGTATRPVLDVRDAANVIAHIIASPSRSQTRTYNVASGNVTVLQIADAVAAAAAKRGKSCEFLQRPAPPRTRNYKMRGDRLASEYSMPPMHDLASTIDLLFDVCERIGPDAIYSARYENLLFLKPSPHSPGSFSQIRA